MCIIAGLSALGIGGTAAAGATAAGATAAASTVTLSSVLQTVGLLAGVGGAIASGVQARDLAEAEAQALEVQKQQQAQLNAIEDQRVTREMRRQISQQRAQLSERGVTLDSPTAVFLGQTAAEELAFASQTVRQTGAAEQTELSAQQRALRSRGKQSLFKGNITAAGKFLTGAPEVWPELLA